MLTNSKRKDRPEISSQFEQKRKEAFAFVLSLWNAPIHKIAVENPFGYLNYGWRKPNQNIGVWMFGHPFKKKLCLWLKNLPILQPTAALFPPLPYKTFDFWSRDRNPNGRSLKSITFTGVAQAMADQWG
jgi:hypothetical protein